jgi:hypothetical protein
LANKVDRQKPNRQRQLGALEQRPGNERCLLPTRPTLERRVRPDPKNSVAGVAAIGTNKALRSSGLLQLGLTLGFGAELPEKLGHR